MSSISVEEKKTSDLTRGGTINSISENWNC